MKISIKKNQINNYLKKFKKNGYVKIKNLIDLKSSNIIKKSLLDFIENYSKQLTGRDINFSKKTKKIYSIHNLKKCKIINQLLNDKKIIQLAELFVGEKTKKFGAELFAKPSKTGIAAPDHQDNYYWNLNNDNGITIRIALEKSTKKNGTIYYYNGSHKIGIQPHIPSNIPGSSQKIKHIEILKFFKLQTPNLSVGDILIHHSAVIHGSGKNLSNNSRMGLNLRYIPKKSKINYFLKKNYEKNLKISKKNFLQIK